MSDESKFWKIHEQILRERAISVEYAWVCGLRSWDGAAVPQMLSEFKIDPRERFPGLPLYRHGTGIDIPHVIESVDGIGRCRIRLDETSVEVAAEDVGTRSHRTKIVELPRYVAQAGVPVTIYKPPFVRLADGGDPVPWAQIQGGVSIPIYITEAPLKALSLSDHGMPAIGLGGVLAGPHVSASTLEDWGRRSTEPGEHPASSTRPGINRLAAYVVFDANLAFRPLVALGAARLAYLLQGLGADVRIVRLPLRLVHDVRGQTEDQALVGKGDQDQGPDDFIYMNGLPAFRQLIDEAGPADPVAMIAALPQDGDRRRLLGEPLESLYFRAYCLVRGEAYVTTYVAAAMRPSFKVAEVRAAVKEFREHMAEQAKAQRTDDERRDFSVKGGRLFLGDVDLADFTAKIVEEIIADNGSERSRIYKVSGELAGGIGLATVDVDADDFHKMEWVAQHWGAKATMRTRRWNYVAEGIQRLSEPKVSTRYTHFGWRTLDGERAYLMPGGAITRNGWVDLTVEAPERLARYKVVRPPEGDEAEEAFLVSRSILLAGPRHVTAPAWLTVFMAPLVDMLGPTFLTWFHGPSGNYKSTLAAMLQSHYGDFTYKTLPETWVSTANALETTLWRGKDVLLTIDNFRPAAIRAGSAGVDQ